jgi:hypothetical protein
MEETWTLWAFPLVETLFERDEHQILSFVRELARIFNEILEMRIRARVPLIRIEYLIGDRTISIEAKVAVNAIDDVDGWSE